MALLESLSLPLGSAMPEFKLPDAEGNMYNSHELSGTRGLVVIFTCNHCPYAKAIWPRTVEFYKKAKRDGVEFVAINPNIHPDYPEDKPAVMLEKITEWNIEFNYLVDESQQVARAFEAQCTPDLYLYDSNYKLYYHGRFDDNWKDEANVKVHDLSDAINELTSGNPAPENQSPSIGCSIKWLG